MIKCHVKIPTAKLLQVQKIVSQCNAIFLTNPCVCNDITWIDIQFSTVEDHNKYHQYINLITNDVIEKPINYKKRFVNKLKRLLTFWKG
jgi:hypothetical protein